MTYCVGLLVEAGLVMMSDTRTNAGVDNISIYRKLHVVADAADRMIVIATAGNLSVSQAVLAMLEEGVGAHLDDELPCTPHNVPTMFRMAQLVGEAVAAARRTIGASLAATAVNAGIGLLLGGRIGSEAPSLFQVYNEGNFIECQPDAPFLQIGEFKYGKPILDRALTWQSPLDEAVKVALISFDATIRSNLSVGRPIDMIAMPADASQPVTRRRIDVDDEYYNMLSAAWGRLLNESRAQIPDPPFMTLSAAMVGPNPSTALPREAQEEKRAAKRWVPPRHSA
jgi:putative proteasome-type protease